jgi:hypothetical protein
MAGNLPRLISIWPQRDRLPGARANALPGNSLSAFDDYQRTIDTQDRGRAPRIDRASRVMPDSPETHTFREHDQDLSLLMLVQDCPIRARIGR